MRPKTEAVLWLSGRGVGWTAVCPTEQGNAGFGAALHREDERPEPGATHAADHPLHGQRAGPSDGLLATAFRATLHVVGESVTMQLSTMAKSNRS